MSCSLFFNLPRDPVGQWVKRIAYKDDQFDNVRTVNNIGIEVSTALFKRLIDDNHFTKLSDVLSNKFIKVQCKKDSSARQGTPTEILNIDIDGFECFNVSIYKKRPQAIINLHFDLGETQTKVDDVYKNVIRLNIHIEIFKNHNKLQPYYTEDKDKMFDQISLCAKTFKDNAIKKTMWLKELDKDNVDQFNDTYNVNYKVLEVIT